MKSMKSSLETFYFMHKMDPLKGERAMPVLLLLIIASASADATADKSAAKYSEMSAILGVLSHILPPCRLESDF